VKRLLRLLGAAGLALGVLAYPAAWAVDAAAGRDLLIIEAAAADAVDAQRGLWEIDGSPKEGVPSIYGTPRGVERLVLVPPGKVLVPKEDPALSIYLKAAGDHPTQAMTLYFFALPAAVGGIVAGAALLLVASRMKGAAAAPSPPAA
jgi:hypothetical protein